MKVCVDQTKCNGHARCMAFAPEVFAWNDEDDRSYVPDGVEVTGHEERIRQAVQNCPERAINTEE